MTRSQLTIVTSVRTIKRDVSADHVFVHMDNVLVKDCPNVTRFRFQEDIRLYDALAPFLVRFHGIANRVRLFIHDIPNRARVLVEMSKAEFERWNENVEDVVGEFMAHGYKKDFVPYLEKKLGLSNVCVISYGVASVW